jgi:hypothetical protein
LPAEFSNSHGGDWERQSGSGLENLNKPLELLGSVGPKSDFEDCRFMNDSRIHESKKFASRKVSAKVVD